MQQLGYVRRYQVDDDEDKVLSQQYGHEGKLIAEGSWWLLATLEQTVGHHNVHPQVGHEEDQQHSAEQWLEGEEVVHGLQLSTATKWEESLVSTTTTTGQGDGLAYPLMEYVHQCQETTHGQVANVPNGIDEEEEEQTQKIAQQGTEDGV